MLSNTALTFIPTGCDYWENLIWKLVNWSILTKTQVCKFPPFLKNDFSKMFFGTLKMVCLNLATPKTLENDQGLHILTTKQEKNWELAGTHWNYTKMFRKRAFFTKFWRQNIIFWGFILNWGQFWILFISSIYYLTTSTFYLYYWLIFIGRNDF